MNSYTDHMVNLSMLVCLLCLFFVFFFSKKYPDVLNFFHLNFKVNIQLFYVYRNIQFSLNFKLA